MEDDSKYTGARLQAFLLGALTANFHGRSRRGAADKQMPRIKAFNPACGMQRGPAEALVLRREKAAQFHGLGGGPHIGNGPAKQVRLEFFNQLSGVGIGRFCQYHPGPCLRNADQMSFADIEKKIAEYGAKARDGKLGIEEMTGGTFSISNGGVFGSMLSTPIINPPQSAILGVHATKDRAVVENGQVVVRPINYLAMSYDHRIIDGREAVLGLVAMKEALEDPARLLFDI